MAIQYFDSSTPLNIGGNDERVDRRFHMSISDERAELCFVCYFLWSVIAP
jgi:hypothetical protein